MALAQSMMTGLYLSEWAIRLWRRARRAIKLQSVTKWDLEFFFLSLSPLDWGIPIHLPSLNPLPGRPPSLWSINWSIMASAQFKYRSLPVTA